MSDKPRVLMIDDSDLSLEFQEMLLKRKGFEVSGITSVSELGNQAADWPHFVLVDANMPDAEPHEAVAAARAAHPAARVLLVSGLDSDELQALAREVKADGSVSKAGDIKQLPAVLLGMYETPVISKPPDRRQALTDKFRALARQRNETVRGHLAAPDEVDSWLPEVQRLLHTTKGESRLLGLNDVADVAARAERELEAREWDHVLVSLDEIDRLVSQ